jgi:hypothetical protein
MANDSGSFNVVDQSLSALFSGGTAAAQLVSTVGSAKTAGNLLMWDADKNAVDSGISAVIVSSSVATSSPILDSATGEPIFDSNGDWIFP